MLLAPFAFGMLLARLVGQDPDQRMAGLAALALALYTFTQGNWNAFGQFGIMYFLMWAAVRDHAALPVGADVRRPLLRHLHPRLAADADSRATSGSTTSTRLLYLAVIVVGRDTLFAVFSWHVIEKPALSLKDWTPSAAPADREPAVPRRRPDTGCRRPPPVADPAPVLAT